MKTMSSAEFRKTYPRLTEPTKVTANGHIIGTWTPGGILSYDDLPEMFEQILTAPVTPVREGDKTWVYTPPEEAEWPPRTMTIDTTEQTRRTDEFIKRELDGNPRSMLTQAERDAILRRVNKGG